MDTTKFDFLKGLRPDRFFLLAGPCVIEDETSPLFIAETLKNICQKLDIPLVFKGSYRKANRSRASSGAKSKHSRARQARRSTTGLRFLMKLRSPSTVLTRSICGASPPVV